MRTARQALTLAALSGVAGLAAQWVRPHPLPWRQNWSALVQEQASASGVRLVDLAAARAIVDRQDHLVLDARPHADYLAGHLPGALALPALDLAAHLPQVLPLLTPAQPLLVYCSGHTCDESLQVADLLRKQGFTNLVLFAGGIADWQQAGLPLER